VRAQPRCADEVAHDPSDDDHQSPSGGDVPKDSTTSAAVPIASAAKGPASQRQADRQDQGQKREKRRPAAGQGSTDDLG
jgi:hypothetical protein